MSQLTRRAVEARASENLRVYRELQPSYEGHHLNDSVDSLPPSDHSSADSTNTTTETEITDFTETVKKTVKVTRTTKTHRRPRYKDVKFQPQSTIFETEAGRSSIFAGFFTHFWLGTFLLFLKTALENYRNTGYVLDTHVVRTLYRDLPKIAFTDLFLFILTFFNVILQKIIVSGRISWSRAWLVQSLYELMFIVFAIWFPIAQDFPWIGRVFLCLHSLVLLMKQHSYAFFCGYLSVVKKDLALFESAFSVAEKDEQEKLSHEISICKTELKSTLSSLSYPDNVTFFNFFDYMMLPTVVYEIEYPRTNAIRWGYVFEKLAAIFGVFFLMIIVAEQYFYPVVMHALSLRSLPFIEKVKEYPFLLLGLLFPFMLMYLLTWYIIWDAILNEIAELTRFADRYFYGPWWNSVQWDQFARDWNVPVHQFLLRHVYHSTISTFQVSKGGATVITFLLSSIVHELVMFVIFKKLRGYLLCLQMLQLPLVQISKTKFFRDRKVLGNVVFWFGIYTGPSMMCMLYLTF